MAIGEDDKLRREAAAWFTRMREPEVDGARAAFEAWRAQAPEHRQAYDRLVDRYEASAVLGRSRLANLRMRPRPARPARAPALRWAGLAAGLVVAATVGLRVYDGRAAWLGGEPYATSLGEIRTVVLDDGVSLTLDTDTRVTTRRRDDRTQLRLERGRVRVRTPQTLDARAGGARILAGPGVFDLRRTEDNAVDVATLEGRLDLEGEGEGLMLARSLKLKPGQQVRLGRGLPVTPRAASATDRDWPTGLLAFDAAPLASVIAEANRYSAKKIRLAEPELASLQVSGGFRVTRPDALANALAAAFGLTVTTAPGGDLILAREAA